MSLTKERLLSLLGEDATSAVFLPEVASTNRFLMEWEAAAHGTVVIAPIQTGGRGRLGRSFQSPTGGIYLSVLLRREESPGELLHLTPMAAVAVRRAILEHCSLPVEIKWINDLVIRGKKVCGILTQRRGDGGLIVGVGLNCTTQPEQFSPEVRSIATSLSAEVGEKVDPNLLAASVIRQLWTMDACLLSAKEAWLKEYAQHCVTIGSRVQVLRSEERREALALGIDDAGGLLVRYDNGEEATVTSGEVSVRGMYGYL